ncbi:MAG: FtsH protease activity modulator HflK [Thermodesulfobacteriota bacterium]|nr:FtsH protease activity modulator HflK [Thermodesulfobacteriota bacterium]
MWEDSGRGKGPWGDGGRPPDFNEFIEQIRNRFTKKNRFYIILIILILIVVIASLSCFYTVDVGEVGVIQRFGKFVRLTEPGLHIKFPAGIEALQKVNIKYTYTQEFGLRTVRAGVRTQYAPGREYIEEALMLTGDLNCAVVPWIVQFQVKDPYKYLFKVRNVISTLRDLSEAIMRQVVGDRSINEVINSRKEIADTSKGILQKALDEAETGIRIVNVEMKRTNVPKPVQPSFNEVNQAIQEKETMIYQAREKYNKAIPAAKGDAEKTIKGAEGYALDRINRAKGDAVRFKALWKEYNEAKDITRRRLYLEALEEVIPNLGGKYIIDPNQQGYLPILNLNKKEMEK